MSYSTSSARSDLKEFTSPMAAYNFRMRAICDVSDIRTFLRLMLNQCPGTTQVYRKPHRLLLFGTKEGSAVRLLPLHGCYCESSDAPSRMLPRHSGDPPTTCADRYLELMTMAQRHSLSSF